MTNREAIDILEEVKALDDSMYAYNPAYTEALDKAIDSLRASVATSCGDTISRQAVIDLLKQMRKDGDMVPWEGKNVFARIRKLPSAQPEIIRCKDCIYYDKGYDEDTADWCHAWCEMTSVEGYCHNAERGGEQNG